MVNQSGQGTPLVLYDLVAVGASAGGIEALSTVLGALSKDFPAPIVVAQHLDPTRPSHLDAILARRTPLEVALVTDVAPLLPGTVYVVPSDRDIEISDHEVRMQASRGTPSNPSINRLLSSATRVYGERLIAVILTGTGSDGAEGAREVKAAGGLVMIENPDTAAFPGMPRSLAPTTVDIVANLDQIGPLLTDLLAGTYVPSEQDGDHPPEGGAEDELLTGLLAEVRQHSGIDFSGYRQPTILRRLQRRMVVTKSPRLEDYQRYLKRHPEEYHRLVSSFLIKVTEFFRDPEFFQALRERVLPELITQARSRDQQLRLWSAGCATGEEAYSLAILVAEVLGPELGEFTIRLFATDLDEQAVAFARQGVYPAAALAGVSEELRSRYFTHVDGAGGTYEVKKVIRSLVTCGEHDLGIRPPFPHIDLVLCRNVLIYFTPAMQQRALSLFAYALRPGGYLVLGKAESTGALAEYLAPADPDLKLYRRVGETLLPPLLLQPSSDFSPPHPMPAPPHYRQTAEHTEPVRDLVTANTEPVQVSRSSEELARTDDWYTNELTRQLLYDLPVGVVIVDRRYNILTINSAALRLLDIYRPAIGEDLVHLAERVPVQMLRRVIDAVFHPTWTAEEEDQAKVDAGKAEDGEEPGDVEIAAFPYPPRRAGARTAAAQVETALLLVSDITGAVAARVAAELVAARNRSAPEQALQRQGDDIERLRAQVEQMSTTNRQLVAANQELGRANLELQRVNDEVLLAQEQEQASAEEIRTLNEELQASNEELETVNEELEATVEELHNSNDDLAVRTREAQELASTAQQQRQASEAEQARLSAILLSLADAVLVVDPTGKPLLSNTAYTHLFGDASSPLAALDAQGNPLPFANTPEQRAAQGETFVIEFTLEGENGKRRYFEATGEPIQSAGTELGGVIAIRDITERSLHRFQDEFLALASHELRTPLTPLLAYLQLMEKLFASKPQLAENTSARRYLLGALNQVRHLRRLTQDLVDVRRLQQGRFSLEMKGMPLEQVVAESVAQARMVAPEGQKIVLESPGTSTLIVDGDALRLEQVIMNLLSNALTYAPHSPRIEVRLRREGDAALVQVEDAGPGIPAADLTHIFERFYQSTSTEERPSRRGLGLGLYIAHELVAAHGGRLEVASVMAPNRGHGTTFTIHLPLAPPDASEAPGQEPAGQEAPGHPSRGRGLGKRLRIT
jgi:two-component system CheB/CheR fusion protein